MNINAVNVMSEATMRENVVQFLKSYVSNMDPKRVRKAVIKVNNEFHQKYKDKHNTRRYIVELNDKYFDRRYCVKCHSDEYSSVYKKSTAMNDIRDLKFHEIGKDETEKSLMLQLYLPYVNFILKALNERDEVVSDAVNLHSSLTDK